tara:strand:- start:5043 stop:6122 length:1080 start_codon:yes stop_codon:yes gene_type:complete
MKLGLYYRDINTHVGDSFDVRSILKGLSEENQVIVFCSKKNHHKFIHPNITYYQSKSTLKLLIDIFKKRNEIEYFNMFCGLIYTLPFVALLLKLIGIKYVYYPFGQLMPLAMKKKGSAFKKKIYLNLLLKPLLNNAWRIIANSKYEKKVIEKLVMSSNIIIAPLSIQGYELKKIESLAKKEYYTYIGRLDIWHKGLDIMLEAISLNKNLFYDNKVTVMMAGRGKPVEIESIQSLINRFDLNEIVILKSNISDEEKIEILNKSFFFIHPSRVEGFARSMREAIHLEIPLITTYDSNVGDYIADFKCGYSSDFSVSSIANAIQNSFLNIKDLSVFDFKPLKEKLTWSKTTNIILKEFVQFK